MQKNMQPSKSKALKENKSLFKSLQGTVRIKKDIFKPINVKWDANRFSRCFYD